MDNNLPNAPKLYNIIAAILCDISKAQDISNRYSLELAKQYRDDPSGLLKEFPVPNGVLDDLKIDFRIMAEDILKDEQGQNSMGFYIQAFKNVAEQIAAEASDEMINAIKHQNDSEQMAAFLKSKRWLQYLTYEIIKVLCDCAMKYEFVSLTAESESMIINNIRELISLKLIQHEDIINLKLSNETVTDFQSKIENYLYRWQEHIWQDLLEYKKFLEVPSLLGRIKGSEGNPTEQYINFSMNVKMRDFNWDVIVQEDADQKEASVYRFKRGRN